MARRRADDPPEPRLVLERLALERLAVEPRFDRGLIVGSTGEHRQTTFDLTGRRALVTGGGRGLGRAIAVALGAAGADVAVAARSQAQLTQVAGALRALGRASYPLVADLSVPEGVESLASALNQRWGPVDVVVHAAGTQVRKPAVELRWAEWEEVMRVNAASGFFLSTSLMRAQPAEHPVSRHIFVTSLTSSIGIVDTSAYAASKSAVVGVVRSLAVEWAPLGVTVNAIQPGYFRTELTDAVFADPVRRAWIESRIPLGRSGSGDDLAGVAVFLASDAAGYLTGQSVAVDGGWLAS